MTDINREKERGKLLRYLVETWFLLILAVTVFTPDLVARLERRFDIDLFHAGRCRIENPRAVFATGDRTARLVAGVVSWEGKEYGHLWGVAGNGRVIDVVCPETEPSCRDRRTVAIFNPWQPGLPVVETKITGIGDMLKTTWGRRYLQGYLGI